MALSFMDKSYEDIMADKDIKAGLEYLMQRASTIRELKIILMILEVLAERTKK